MAYKTDTELKEQSRRKMQRRIKDVYNGLNSLVASNMQPLGYRHRYSVALNLIGTALTMLSTLPDDDVAMGNDVTTLVETLENSPLFPNHNAG